MSWFPDFVQKDFEQLLKLHNKKEGKLKKIKENQITLPRWKIFLKSLLFWKYKKMKFKDGWILFKK